jgi:hypothetical protein
LNGTFLNGQKIDPDIERELRFGDIIGLGVSHEATDVDVRGREYFVFIFKVSDGPSNIRLARAPICGRLRRQRQRPVVAMNRPMAPPRRREGGNRRNRGRGQQQGRGEDRNRSNQHRDVSVLRRDIMDRASRRQYRSTIRRERQKRVVEVVPWMKSNPRMKCETRSQVSSAELRRWTRDPNQTSAFQSRLTEIVRRIRSINQQRREVQIDITLMQQRLRRLNQTETRMMRGIRFLIQALLNLQRIRRVQNTYKVACTRILRALDTFEGQDVWVSVNQAVHHSMSANRISRATAPGLDLLATVALNRNATWIDVSSVALPTSPLLRQTPQQANPHPAEFPLRRETDRGVPVRQVPTSSEAGNQQSAQSDDVSFFSDLESIGSQNQD